jgi:predicted lipoprotein with Yx(FWY)xxD motif
MVMLAADHSDTSTCYKVCAEAWPPLLTKGAPSVGTGLKAKLLGTTMRKDGTMQVTYNGHPLYRYSADMKGKAMCQHVNMHGGYWYVVTASGMPDMAKGKGMQM